MATTNQLKKTLNRKLWEMCNPAPTAHSSGACVISSRDYKNQQLYLATGTSAFMYLPEEDGFIAIPNPSLSGTFGNGTCGTGTAIGPSGTATAGSATTLTTNQNIQRDLRGFKIHITGGPGAGDVVEITGNTIGTNSVISAAFSATITTATTYRLLTPRWYVNNGGTPAAGSFKFYCFALNTWTNATQTGLPTFAGDSRLIATPSIVDGAFNSFATGTATSGTANTIVNTPKGWAVNQWANYQIRITAGTGLGQVRTIASNTANTITVSTNWTVNPDATSQYSIEGNDDYLYLTGNSTNAMYRYSISAGTWTTMATRSANTGQGVGGNWIWGVTDSAWTAENSIINGRRIYAFRGNGGSILDYYDIPTNTWVNDIAYSPKAETLTIGTKYVYNGNFIYIQKDNTGRWFRYDLAKSAMDGWSVNIYPQGSANIGNTAWDVTYKDGATEIVFIYMMLNSSAVLMRTMVI